SPDLEQLNTKIADLAKETKSITDLPKKVGDLGQRVGAIDKSVATMRDEINALKGEVKKVGNQPAEAARADTTKPEDVNVADSAMEQGVELFKAGKYKEASDVFRKLTDTNPNDARVWYFAALSHGQDTKQWQGETTRLVE